VDALAGTLKRVDVVFRRVDATYTDPLDLRADSRLGVAVWWKRNTAER